jgi:hypothetical protein
MQRGFKPLILRGARSKASGSGRQFNQIMISSKLIESGNFSADTSV